MRVTVVKSLSAYLGTDGMVHVSCVFDEPVTVPVRVRRWK